MDNIININEYPINYFPLDTNREIQAELYEQVFNLVSQILMDVIEKKEQLLLMKIVQKIIQNIIEKTMFQEDSEKYRRLKLSNPNIEKLFKIDQAYDFITFLGFTEKAIDNELYLYLEENKIDEQLLVILSYLNLLILNEEESINNCNDNQWSSNSYRNDNYINYDFNSNQSNDINSNNNQSEINTYPKAYYKKAGIVDILKSTKDVRLGKTLILPENCDKVLYTEQVSNSNNNNNNKDNDNNYPYPRTNQIAIRNPYYQPKDVKSILKETANIRRDNAMIAQYYPNYQFNSNVNNHSNGSSNIFSNKNNNNPNERPREMSLRDLEFNNPDIYNSSIVTEEVGKKCLELTNEFRVKNNLPRLAWDDEVWRIAYEHSKNMGNRVVPFGHDGFNERIKKFKFYSSLSCENVFMCFGHSHYGLPEMAVNGWINSPGHRKNMLTYTSHCAISTYRNGYGEFYLTQIFVKKM